MKARFFCNHCEYQLATARKLEGSTENYEEILEGSLQMALL
jgi:hypothetical protein